MSDPAPPPPSGSPSPADIILRPLAAVLLTIRTVGEMAGVERSTRMTPVQLSTLNRGMQGVTDVRSTLLRLQQFVLGTDDLDRADPAFVARIDRTYPGFTPDEILRAARLLLDEYERVVPAYCDETGLDYPGEKVNAVRRLLDQCMNKR